MGTHARTKHDYQLKSRICLPDTGPISDPARGRDHQEGVPENITRRAKRFRADLIKYGYQQGCLGCKMMKEGKPAQSHNESCRTIIEGKLKGDKYKRFTNPQGEARAQASSDKRPAEDHGLAGHQGDIKKRKQTHGDLTNNQTDASTTTPLHLTPASTTSSSSSSTSASDVSST